MNNIIQKGYRMTVRSWENDGDNYQTITRDGMTEHNVNMYVELLKPLMYDHSTLTRGKFANMYEPDASELVEFAGVMDPILKKYEIEYDSDVDPVENAYNVLGAALDYVGDFTGTGEFFTRVVDDIQIEYVPQMIEFQNMNSKFGVL